MEAISMGHALSILDKFKADYDGGVLVVFGGTRPANASAAETGTPLVIVTEGGLTHTAGQTTNGLVFSTPAANGTTDARTNKNTGTNWTGTVLAAAGTGTQATHFRFYDKNHTTGASTTAKRFDGDASTLSTAELYWSNLSLVQGAPFTINDFPIIQALS